MTTMTADDLADSINRGKKWKVIGCIGHDCEECQTRIAKNASHRSTAQKVDMKMVIDRAVVEQALHVAESAGYPVALIKALRAALAQQAEPLNLSDPAVRKRLASQWGYVHDTQQAEPVEPVAALIAQRDALLEALKEIAENSDDVGAIDCARAAIRARTP